MRGGPAGLGCGGLILVLAVSYFTGQDPRAILQLLSTVQEQTAPQEQAPAASAPHDRLGTFAALVLKDTEDTWTGIFAQANQTYEDPPARSLLPGRAIGLRRRLVGHRPLLLSG